MIVAEFIGTDGSCGFRYGKTYTLREPDVTKHDWKIMIENADGAQWCSYNTGDAFLTPWTVLRCI